MKDAFTRPLVQLAGGSPHCLLGRLRIALADRLERSGDSVAHAAFTRFVSRLPLAVLSLAL
jgi:hypothetical protein